MSIFGNIRAILRGITGMKKAGLTGAVVGVPLGVVMASGVTLAAVTISNTLSLGPSDVYLPTTLTKVEGLPAQVPIGAESDVEFTMTAVDEISDATLWLELSGDGVELDDPSIVEVEYRIPDSGSRDPVSMAAADGNLRGQLKSGWDIDAGFEATGEVRITFQGHAPETAYSANIWVEGEVEAESGSDAGDPGPTPTPTPTPSGGSSPQTVDVTATDDDTFAPSSVTINAGDTVRWTIAPDTVHNVDFDDASLQDSPSALTGGQTYAVTFDAPGAYSYWCTIHGRDMSGTVTVQ